MKRLGDINQDHDRHDLVVDVVVIMIMIVVAMFVDVMGVLLVVVHMAPLLDTHTHTLRVHCTRLTPTQKSSLFSHADRTL